MRPVHHGEIVRRKSRTTGTIVSLYSALEADLDPAGGPWATVCEAHGTICNHRTKTLALAHLPTVGWCEACMGQDDEGAEA